MQASHWGLSESPYRTALDPRFFYRGPVHEEALARMQFLVDEHYRLGLLLGDAGTGKSLLLEYFARQLRSASKTVALVDVGGIDRHELLWQVASQWGTHPSPAATPFQLWRAVTDRVVENRLQGIETILLLDEIERAETTLAAQIVRLVQNDPAPDSRLTTIAAARPDRLAQIDERLLELASLRVDLVRWDQGDTVAYLNKSLAEAGREEPVFAEPAIERLHELAGGVPRRVSQLADLALLAGAGAHLEVIDPDTIEAVHAELGVLPPAETIGL